MNVHIVRNLLTGGLVDVVPIQKRWREKTNAFGRTVMVNVKSADFQIITRSQSIPTAIGRHEALRQASLTSVRTVLPTVEGIRLRGVTVSRFDRETGTEDTPVVWF